MPDLESIYQSQATHSHAAGLEAVFRAGVETGKDEATPKPLEESPDVIEAPAEQEHPEVEEGQGTEEADGDAQGLPGSVGQADPAG